MPCLHESLIPARVLSQYVTGLKNLALRNGEEIHLVLPQAVLHHLLSLGVRIVGILSDFHTIDGLEVLVGFLPATNVEEAVALEGQLDEALLLIRLTGSASAADRMCGLTSPTRFLLGALLTSSLCMPQRY